MAIYQNDYPHHKDTVQKVPLTKNDIDFLLELQKEMNTQDENSQADPRFWVIRQTEKRYRVEEPDGFELVVNGEETIAKDMEELINYIQETILPDLNEEYSDICEYKIEKENETGYHCIYKKYLTEDGTEEEEGICTLTDEEDVINFIDEYDEIVGKHELVSYKNIEVNIPNTMFLTHKESENHLRRNAHNYKPDAHSYSMTAFRSPEVERLYKIIQTVDWESLKGGE